MSFYLSTSGTSGYAYILHNNGFQLNVAQFKSSLKNYLPIQIRISSEYLWSYGISNSWSIIYNWIVETFGNIAANNVASISESGNILVMGLASLIIISLIVLLFKKKTYDVI